MYAGVDGFVQVVHASERVVRVHGHQSTMGYLCGSVTLTLSSGRTLAFVGENASVWMR